jgi:hypothetical protein
MDSKKASSASWATTDSEPPINDIGIREFFKLIGEYPPQSLKAKGRKGAGSPQLQVVLDEQNNQHAKGQETKFVPAFGELKALINFLENCLKHLVKNGSYSFVRYIECSRDVQELDICQRGGSPSIHHSPTK